MTKLLPHHRLHVPNGLAMLAAVLLLVSSVAGFETKQEGWSSSPESTPSVQAETNTNDSINDATEHKRRGLNLGLLLFRRG